MRDFLKVIGEAIALGSRGKSWFGKASEALHYVVPIWGFILGLVISQHPLTAVSFCLLLSGFLRAMSNLYEEELEKQCAQLDDVVVALRNVIIETGDLEQNRKAAKKVREIEEGYDA